MNIVSKEALMLNRFLPFLFIFLPFLYGFAPSQEFDAKIEPNTPSLLEHLPAGCGGILGVESSPLGLARAHSMHTASGLNGCSVAVPPTLKLGSRFAGTVKYDLPIVMNDKVVKWMEYFQGRGRRHFVRWLSRYERYSPMILETLKAHKLPEDLVFLAMIESGFQPFAYSRARASGLWQFMRRTGQQYGLKVNWWVDERRDPFKATVAAARHIRDLFDEFGNWYLVAASYNAGAGKVRRAIRRYKTRDFWELIKGRYLRSETRNYVPKLLAAAIIAKNPEAYGFRGIQYQEPLTFDVVEVPHAVDLGKVANAVGVSKKQLQNLNPELRRGITPPQRNSKYSLRVPEGYGDRLQPKLAKVKANINGTLITHRVRRGDSLWKIARAYGTSISALRQINSRANTRVLRPGQRLMVPTGKGRYAPPPKRRSQSRPAVVSGGNYKVRSGDSLWSIAQAHGTTVRDLRRLNSRSRTRVLRPGQRLKIPSTRKLYAMKDTASGAKSKSGGSAIQYRVRSGDSLWTIAKRFNVSVRDLKRWNSALRGNRIFAGDLINIRNAS